MTERELRPADGDEIDLIEYGAAIWRHRWMIAGLCAVALAATLVVTIRTPKVYESTAALLVPREGAGLTLSGALQQVGLPSLSLPSLSPNRDLLLSVLKSRTVAQAVVERFGLRERYQVEKLGAAVKTLQAFTSISVSREGVVLITVGDTDPQAAAEMANFYVEQADRLVAQSSTGDAGRQRGFLTAQLARARVDLEAAEESLRRFQERHRAVALQEQTRGAVEGGGRLKGEIMAAEVQLQVMRNFATEANPEVVALRRRIEEMRRQLAQMQYGDGRPAPAPAAGQDRRDFGVSLPKIPEIGLELARLAREVKVQETLVTILAQHVEQARMAEAKDLPIVLVLDRAVPAERHVSPRLRLNLAIAGVTSLFMGMFLAFFVEYVKNARRRRRAV